MQHLEEIKLRLNIEELVGSYVQLKKAGRNLKGLCPFHSEKTPSFMVSPEKGIAYCFGCHKGGDIFKFTQLVENVDFGEAVKILAEKTNVKLPSSIPRVHNQRLTGIEINQAALAFYQGQLTQHPDQKEYFIKRGLSEETIQHFQLGFAPDSFDKLKNELQSKGFESKDLIQSGIMNQRSIADQNFYDRFRNRLIFPIFDHQGNPVAFSGRIVGEGEPKYLNSPDSPTYNKSLVLYGLNWAKEAIKEQKLAIFVEGYMDVIAAHQVDTKNVIATCGTALTPQQLKLIRRYTDTVAFAFDQDSAGLEATMRAIELAQQSDLKLKVIAIPEGKDPDDCIKSDPDSWHAAVKNPVSVMDFYFNYALSHWKADSIEGKKAISNFLLPLIKSYQSQMEQGEYLNRLALTLKTDVKLLWNDLNKLAAKRIYQPQSNDVAASDPNQLKSFTREAFLIGFIINYPEHYQIVQKQLIDSVPFDPETELIFKTIKAEYQEGEEIKIDDIKQKLDEETVEQMNVFGLLIEEHYPDFSSNAAEREIKKLVDTINQKNLRQVQKEYEYKIRITQDPDDRKLLLNRYNELLKLSTKI